VVNWRLGNLAFSGIRDGDKFVLNSRSNTLFSKFLDLGIS
jgi:hypothetical protein